MTPPPVSIRILAAAAILAIGLVGVVAREGLARAQGQEVALPITGYDPRSLLTGHYVQFQFAHDLTPSQACAAEGDAAVGRADAWFAVARQGGQHRIAAVAADRAQALRRGAAAIRGSTVCYGSLTPRPGAPPGSTDATITLDLGVDRLHIDQKTAEALQAQLAGPEAAAAYAILSVGRDGRARLKALQVGGRRAELGWF